MSVVKVGLVNRFRRALASYRYRHSPIGRLVREGRASIGAGSYGNPMIATFGFDRTNLHIGKYSSIGARTLFVLGGEHPIRKVSTFPFRIRFGMEGAGSDGHPSSKGDIVVGNDVWIGTRSTILSGVCIGDGAVVAAGSVVVKNVAPYSIVGGNPARVVGFRFTDNQIDALLSIEWWNWPQSDILGSVDLLSDESVDEFIARYGCSG